MKLSTQQLARLSRLLDEVVDADPAARDEWLHALAPEHRDLEPALRRALLPPQNPRGGDTLAAALPDLSAWHGTHPSGGLQAGEQVGPYRLTRQLGAGGMAEVWLAQRADGAFKREVALKMPARLPWRRGLAERFAVECDILASLEHPHIARLYDAGVSDDGRPYFALEYVAGTSLLQWANERRLGIRQRIELFLQVLQAVQYAHDKGVLHRDIKPGNLLVTDAGQVKLLDFGVARLIERPAEAELTGAFGRAFTPGYASPEQLRGDAVDATSDVYSLGVVLYELLSGRAPFETGGAPASSAPAVQRPPSARVDTQGAEARGGSKVAVGRVVRGDLDAITLKALSYAPADRYASVDAFASDLRRYLSSQTVRALPDSLAYRARRFVGRHRAGIAVAGLAGVAVGIGSALWQPPRAVHPPPDAGTAGVAQSPAAPALPADRAPATQPLAEPPAQPPIERPDPEAYALVQQGDVYANGPFERDAQRAEVAYKKAAASDPGYALPWVRLALLYLREGELSRLPLPRSSALAREAIDQALRIAPDSMAARAARFRYLVRAEARWAEARAELDRMRALDPRDTSWLPDCEAMFAGLGGNLDEAIRLQQRIVARDPSNAAARGVLAFYLFHGDHFAQSLALLRRELHTHPHAAGNHALIGVNLALLGHREQALMELGRERHAGRRLWALAIVQWLSGRRAESDAALKALKSAPLVDAYAVAQLHAMRGESRSAFAWLKRACARPAGGCETLQVDRFLRELRDDPRYRALLGSLGFAGAGMVDVGRPVAAATRR